MGRNTIRLATVIAAGHKLEGQRFVVQQWPDGKVHCWGQVVAYRGGKRTHENSITFLDSEVTVADADNGGQALSIELHEQYLDDLEERGALINRNRHSYEIVRGPFSDAFIATAQDLGIAVKHLIRRDDIDTINELIGE